MNTIDVRNCRMRTAPALRRALKHLQNESPQTSETMKMINAVEKALKDLLAKDYTGNIFLSRFISKRDADTLKKENIQTVYDLLFCDLRHLRILIRGKRSRKIPTILFYLHPEKKVRSPLPQQ